MNLVAEDRCEKSAGCVERPDDYSVVVTTRIRDNGFAADGLPRGEIVSQSDVRPSRASEPVLSLPKERTGDGLNSLRSNSVRGEVLEP